VDLHGHVVTSRRKILVNYLKTFFVIDLVALLPFDYMMGGNDDSKVGRAWGLLPSPCPACAGSVSVAGKCQCK
jgi:hypothetical protein